MTAPFDHETTTMPSQEFSPAEPVATARYALHFSGSGNDYFKIWITNLLLTILSFGIYSAWAKVRREQYFHRNTQLDDSGFDYHGRPIAILKGRIIAWGLLLALGTVNEVAPEWYFTALLLASPLLPWLILRSFIFRARNTSYRGLRFDFDGTYKEAARVILGWGFLAILSAGLVFPIFMQRLKAFQFNHLSYGGQRFALKADVGGFYIAFLIVSLVILIPLILMGILIGIGVFLDGIGEGYKNMSAIFLIAAIAMFVIIYLATLLIVQPFLQVRLSNLVWNNTQLGPHGFASTQAMSTLFPVFLTNWLLILLTLGLFWPWAKIRLANYRAQHTFMLTSGSLDQFVGQTALQRVAIGEEIADAFDLDISF